MSDITDPDPNEDVTELDYQDALDELERILDRLETDRPDVDRVAADVARAAALVEHCRGRIHSARKQVAAVVDPNAAGGPARGSEDPATVGEGAASDEPF